MTDILDPSKNRRFMFEVAGKRRYHRNLSRASAAARGGPAETEGLGFH